VAVPYFAIAWPAARAVARALLDGALDVRGRSVADVGCGSGLVACAALKAGAARALAVDADARAVSAAVELGRRHGVPVEGVVLNALATPDSIGAERIICADLVSRAEHAAPFARALEVWRGRGARVVLADSGRPFFQSYGATLFLTRTLATGSRVDGVGTREGLEFSFAARAPRSAREISDAGPHLSHYDSKSAHPRAGTPAALKVCVRGETPTTLN
jgi:SAM-dependent methyltransferase